MGARLTRDWKEDGERGAKLKWVQEGSIWARDGREIESIIERGVETQGEEFND